MFNALILGIIQGLTEFLPVSSSGHVTFFEKVLNFQEDNGFAAAIHLATCLAALIYFRKEVLEILKSFINYKKNDENSKKYRDLGISVIIATIPAAILGLIISKLNIDTYFSDLFSIGISAIFFGAILLYADKFSNINNSINQQANKLTSFLIGTSQIIAAIFPGASRSGITLTTSYFFKLEKEFAAKFVFLISIPITALAGFNEIVLKHSVHIDADFFMAFISAFISGLIAIYFLLFLIRKADLKWIIYYRFIFGITVLFYALWR